MRLNYINSMMRRMHRAVGEAAAKLKRRDDISAEVLVPPLALANEHGAKIGWIKRE